MRSTWVDPGAESISRDILTSRSLTRRGSGPGPSGQVQVRVKPLGLHRRTGGSHLPSETLVQGHGALRPSGPTTQVDRCAAKMLRRLDKMAVGSECRYQTEPKTWARDHANPWDVVMPVFGVLGQGGNHKSSSALSHDVHEVRFRKFLDF